MPLNIDESREMDPASRRTFGKLKRYLPQSGTDAQRLALNTSALPVPTRFFDSGNSRDWLWDGSGWIITNEPAQVFNPTVSAASGTITTVGAKSLTYTRSNGQVTWSCDVAITTNGTGAGIILVGLPINANTGQVYIGSGREYALNGSQLECFLGGTSIVQIVYYNNTYPGASGAKLACGGTYLMASRYS